MGTLQELAIQIRDEQRKGANSSTRVGGLLLEMAKLLESSESNNIYISDLSELDNYKMTTHKGAFNVYLRGTLFVGVLFIIQYQAPQHGGLQVFLSTFDYKMSGSSSLSMPSIIYRSTDYNNNQKWLEWKPYQNTFISNDGSVPTNNGLGFNETNFAPSLSLFLKKLAYPKIVSWSGEVIEDADIVSAGTGQVGSIVYILSKKTFALGVGASIAGGYRVYYSFFEGIEDFQQNLYDSINRNSDFVPNFTKNIFKGYDGSIWIADSASSIKKIIDISADAPKDGKQYGRANGKWAQIESAGTVTIDAELSESSTNPVQNAVVTKAVNEAKEVILLPGSLDEITTGLSEPEIKAILGESTVLSVNKAKKIFRDASGNVITNITVNSSVTPYMNDCAITYVSQNVIKKIVAEYSISTNAWKRVREIVIDSPIYQLPGDITAGFSDSNYDQVLGTYPEFKAAYDAGKIFVSKGVMIKVALFMDDEDYKSFNITYNYVKLPGETLIYVFLNMTSDGTKWTDDPTFDKFKLKGELV